MGDGYTTPKRGRRTETAADGTKRTYDDSGEIIGTWGADGSYTAGPGGANPGAHAPTTTQAPAQDFDNPGSRPTSSTQGSEPGVRQRADGTWEAGTWSGPGIGTDRTFTPTPAAGQPTQGTLSSPGTGEQFQQQWGGFFAPGYTSQYQDYGWGEGKAETDQAQANVQPAFDMANQLFNAPNRADEAYQSFMGNRADLALDPNLDAYYKDANRRASEGIENYYASRGMQGGGAEGNAMTDSFANLAGQRARDEMGYSLDRAAEMRLGGATAGGLAGDADRSRLGFMGGGLEGYLGASGREMGGIDLQNRILGGLSEDEQNRIGLGGELAFGAQGAEEGREGDYYDRTSETANDLADIVGEETRALFESDEKFFDAIQAIDPATLRAAIEGDRAARQEVIDTLGVAAKSVGAGAQLEEALDD